MCSPCGDVSGLFSMTVPVFSCWTLPYQSVCLPNKIYWLQNEWLPPCVGWLLCWTHTTEIRAHLLQLTCLEQISPPPTLPPPFSSYSLTFQSISGAIVWLLPLLCPYWSSLLLFALFHPIISGFYLPFCMNVLFLLIYWKPLSCSLKSSGGVGLGLDWTKSTFQLPVF